MAAKTAQRITAVLVNALLEWILIFLLLLNSTLSYLIAKFAAQFGLKQPCFWCSRIEGPNSSRDLCDEHSREISKLGFCSNRPVISARIGFFALVSENEKKIEKIDLFHCLQFKPCCNGDFPHQFLKSRVENGDDLMISDEDTESFSFGPVNNVELLQNNDFLFDSFEEEENLGDIDSKDCFPELESITSFVEAIDEDSSLTIEQLKSALKAQQKALSASYAELEAERNAAAIATSQTMAMISKLQEEKAAMQMEALQYQRMMEEQSEYDQEALQILNNLVIKREKEKQELEKELQVYRQKFSCADDEFLNDNIGIPEVVYKESETDSFEHLSILDESVAEFEEERFCILQELRELEARLLSSMADECDQNVYDNYICNYPETQREHH